MKINKKTISFIGMPGSGKSYFSAILAEYLRYKCIDTDIEIEKKYAMPVSDIFNEHGEDFFRTAESEIINQYVKETNIIISTGGGAVIRNSYILSEKSFVIYIKRDIEDIFSTLDNQNRPLAQNKMDLISLFEKRKSLYESCCDIIIDNNSTKEITITKILEVFDENISHKRT